MKDDIEKVCLNMAIFDYVLHLHYFLVRLRPLMQYHHLLAALVCIAPCGPKMLLMETEGENLLKTKEGKDIYMNLYVIQTFFWRFMKKLSEIGPHPLF